MLFFFRALWQKYSSATTRSFMSLPFALSKSFPARFCLPGLIFSLRHFSLRSRGFRPHFVFAHTAFQKHLRFGIANRFRHKRNLVGNDGCGDFCTYRFRGIYNRQAQKISLYVIAAQLLCLHKFRSVLGVLFFFYGACSFGALLFICRVARQSNLMYNYFGKKPNGVD